MGGLLSAMKYETYRKYDPHHSAVAESAFLIVRAGFGKWDESLVHICERVPEYLCGDLLRSLGVSVGGDTRMLLRCSSIRGFVRFMSSSSSQWHAMHGDWEGSLFNDQGFHSLI